MVGISPIESVETSGTLPRTHLSSFYAVIDKQSLFLFERCDTSKQELVNLKASIRMQSTTASVSYYAGTTMVPPPMYALQIICTLTDAFGIVEVINMNMNMKTNYPTLEDSKQGARVEIICDCSDAAMQAKWYTAFERAILLDNKLTEAQAIAQYSDRLGLGIAEDKDMSIKSVIKVHKRLSLKHHPDKGGDADKFQLITQAKDNLLEILRERACKYVPYEVELEKVGAGVWFGISLTDSKQGIGGTNKKYVIVTEVKAGIRIKSLSPAANGSILEGDILVGIDNDDCKEWTLSRVGARLGLYRVPEGSVVKFTFHRALPFIEIENDATETTDTTTSLSVEAEEKNAAAASIEFENKTNFDAVLKQEAQSQLFPMPVYSATAELHRACLLGDVDVVLRQIAAGASINKANKNQVTPLMQACFNGHVDTVALLLECGANVNQRAENLGRDALCCASQNGHVEVVRLLLAYGANGRIRKAHAIALRNGHMAVARVLEPLVSSDD